MRVGGQWIYRRRAGRRADRRPPGSGIGFIVADAGALLLLIALILGGIGVRRLRSRRRHGAAEATHGDLGRCCSPRTSSPSGRWAASRTSDARTSRPNPRPSARRAMRDCQASAEPGRVARATVSSHERPRAPHLGARDRPSETGIAARLAAPPAPTFDRPCCGLAGPDEMPSPRLVATSAPRYFSISQREIWTRYSSHSLRFSST